MTEPSIDPLADDDGDIDEGGDETPNLVDAFKDRRLFGGGPADVAEDMGGKRIPAAAGSVYAIGETDPSEDLLDTFGNPQEGVAADDRGMVPEFYGPPNENSELELDFGYGRVKVHAVDVDAKLKAHVGADDPHGTYTRIESRLEDLVRQGISDLVLEGVDLSNYLKLSGQNTGQHNRDAGAWLNVVTGWDDDPTAAITIGPNPEYGIDLFSGGQMELCAKVANRPTLKVWGQGKPEDPVVQIRQWDEASPPLLEILLSGFTRFNGLTEVNNELTVTGNATMAKDLTVKGKITVTDVVRAKNIGASRVFSQEAPPSTPQVGDVWIQLQ